jgi:hypothetical protein
MNTLSKMALGLIGQLKPQPVVGEAVSGIALPLPNTQGGVPLLQALERRQSMREFDPASQREAYANVAAGAMVKNGYRYYASEGLSTLVRAWMDRQALALADGLNTDRAVLLLQTVGWPPKQMVPPQ